jgi:hypothetical protein
MENKDAPQDAHEHPETPPPLGVVFSEKVDKPDVPEAAIPTSAWWTGESYSVDTDT